jgi:RNA polymerase sigma-70 factor, ECF subfamily
MWSTMNAGPDRGGTFAENRSKLWSVAYRMLGSRADAEDVVQEAYLRWHGARVEEIETPQAWLVTTTTRLAIDRLRQLRSERSLYTGPWLPEPLVTAIPPAADEAAELASDLSVALLAVLERLAPEERAAFLLREVFDADYAEIARILDKTQIACRQMVSRAAKRVRAERPRVRVGKAAKTRLLRGLVDAVQRQDRDALLGLLAEDATWTSDGGGKARAALKVIRGADKVARFGSGVFRKLVHQLEFRPIAVNGDPGFAVLHAGRAFAVVTIETDGRRILGVYSILNPDKLRDLPSSLNGTSSS